MKTLCYFMHLCSVLEMKITIKVLKQNFICKILSYFVDKSMNLKFSAKKKTSIIVSKCKDFHSSVDIKVVAIVDGRTYEWADLRTDGKPDPYIAQCLRQVQQQANADRQT